MLGGIFPLVTIPMFRRMTFAGASSFLGGVVSNSRPRLSSLCSHLNRGLFSPSYPGSLSFMGPGSALEVNSQAYVLFRAE